MWLSGPFWLSTIGGLLPQVGPFRIKAMVPCKQDFGVSHITSASWQPMLLHAPGACHPTSNLLPPAVNSTFYCLENYKPIGHPIRSPLVDNASKSTSGQVARQCAAACDSEPACTAFKAIGAEAFQGPLCQLLTDSAAAIPSTLQLIPGKDYPAVLDNITSEDGIALRSLSWMCFKDDVLWDQFGIASRELIVNGTAGKSLSSRERRWQGRDKCVCMWICSIHLRGEIPLHLGRFVYCLEVALDSGS